MNVRWKGSTGRLLSSLSLPFLPSFCFLAVGECVRLMSHLLQETAGRVSHNFGTAVVIPHMDCLTRGCPLGVNEIILHLFFNCHKPLWQHQGMMVSWSKLQWCPHNKYFPLYIWEFPCLHSKAGNCFGKHFFKGYFPLNSTIISTMFNLALVSFLLHHKLRYIKHFKLVYAIGQKKKF